MLGNPNWWIQNRDHGHKGSNDNEKRITVGHSDYTWHSKNQTRTRVMEKLEHDGPSLNTNTRQLLFQLPNEEKLA